jgi:hypothetical protein
MPIGIEFGELIFCFFGTANFKHIILALFFLKITMGEHYFFKFIEVVFAAHGRGI